MEYAIAGLVVLLWVLFNWLAPFSVLKTAQPMSIGRIPGEILHRANVHRVRYYTDDLAPKGYAFTVWMGTCHAVILDKTFLKAAAPSQVRFVLAHELGHCALGHTRLRTLAAISGLILLPFVRRRLRKLEEEADKFAEGLSGLPRTILTQQDVSKLFEMLDHSRRM